MFFKKIPDDGIQTRDISLFGCENKWLEHLVAKYFISLQAVNMN